MVRFHYALKGRKNEGGIIDDYGAEQIAKKVILTPVEHDLEFQEFFSSWKIPFKRKKIFIED